MNISQFESTHTRARAYAHTHTLIFSPSHFLTLTLFSVCLALTKDHSRTHAFTTKNKKQKNNHRQTVSANFRRNYVFAP